LSTLKVTIPILLLITTFFTLIGMLIGYLFTSEETSTLAAISIGSIFLFLSNLIVPIESMPPAVQEIAQFNPFVLSEGILKKAIIFKAELSTLVPDVYYLLGASVVLFILIFILQKFTRKHLIHHLAYLARKAFKKKPKKTKTK